MPAQTSRRSVTSLDGSPSSASAAGSPLRSLLSSASCCMSLISSQLANRFVTRSSASSAHCQHLPPCCRTRTTHAQTNNDGCETMISASVSVLYFPCIWKARSCCTWRVISRHEKVSWDLGGQNQKREPFHTTRMFTALFSPKAEQKKTVQQMKADQSNTFIIVVQINHWC